MVNGYNNSPQIPMQTYQRQQIQPQVQPALIEQPQIQNVQSPDAIPCQCQNPMYTPAFQTYPASASGVNINIISPSVYGANKSVIPYSPIYNYPTASNAQATAQATATSQPSPAPEKLKKKNIVPLTDEYIHTLENYLQNSNEQVRLMGAKEVMARFKEDESRRNDAALTALLNKSLQDKSNNIRVLGMTTIAAGYSAGDKNTSILLDNLQQKKSNYNEDAILAANALMKMSSTPQKIKVPEEN